MLLVFQYSYNLSKMSYLILVRHGKSQWNEKGLWTGWTNIGLSEQGVKDAQNMANLIKDLPINLVFTSKLKRAKETAEIILKELNLTNLSIIEDSSLDERNYGIYTGKNKWDIEKEVGKDNFHQLRRGWDYPIPEGETLKDVYQRVIPYFEEQILSKLKEGENILVSAHGNSLRALTKYLLNLSNEEVENLEIGIGEVYIYQFDSNGKVISQKLYGESSDKGKI